MYRPLKNYVKKQHKKGILNSFPFESEKKLKVTTSLLLGIGWASVIIVQFLNIYYIVILGWALFYMFASFTSKLPWSSCDNDWNTANCVSSMDAEKTAVESAVNSSGVNATVIPTTGTPIMMANMSNFSTVPTAIASAAKVSAAQEYWE